MTTTIGILGAAGIAPEAIIWPARRRDDVRIGAVASLTSAQEYADRYGIDRAYPTYEALVADSDVDLVYNALPPSMHAEWTIAALRAGKNVLCEKPFTMTSSAKWPRRYWRIPTSVTPLPRFRPGVLRLAPTGQNARSTGEVALTCGVSTHK